uniref:Proteasome activator complex subunit 3 n=1 Tax=Plectus sambesii TaxID=2011161 RepID=A0A914V5J0_9BILA
MPEGAKAITPTIQLDSYKRELAVEAEKIVHQQFPCKVVEINQLLTSSQFSYDRLPDLLSEGDLNIPKPNQLLNSTENHVDVVPKKRARMATVPADVDATTIEGTKVIGFVNGTVPCNAKIAELIDITRPLLRDAVESVNKVKMWIMFLIPRIEDGNNFGVSIQEETLAEVRTVESEAAGFLDQMSRYFISRARLVTKVAKYPHVDDYRRAIQDMDEKQFINIRLVLTEMRNHFATLHDMITKNLEKIKKPRSNNAEHMY